MAVNTSFVACVIGEWTQLCELRPTRKALLIQLLDGDAVLGVRTSAPITDGNYGNTPSGVWHSTRHGNGPATFRLSDAIDGELVQQAWWGWIVPGSGSGGGGGGSVSLTFDATSTWTVPIGVTSVKVECWGAGGSSFDALANTPSLTALVFSTAGDHSFVIPFDATSLFDIYCWGSGGDSSDDGAGGGGGGFARSGSLAATAGDTWTAHVGITSVDDLSQARNPSSTVVVEAARGDDGAFGVGGNGEAGTIGLDLFRGGDGSDFGAPGAGTNGGAGGSAAGSFADGIFTDSVSGSVGGGTATILTYGQGGTAGDGGPLIGDPGSPGAPFGAGSGGGGSGNSGVVPGAPGAVVFFFVSSIGPGPSTGGGGSGGYGASTIAVVPGSTYPVTVGVSAGANPTTNPTDSWFSNTGVAPTIPSQGAFAIGGSNAAGAGQTGSGGGGSSSVCVGTTTLSGGSGGNGQVTSGLAGGGGGGGSPDGISPGGNGGADFGLTGVSGAGGSIFGGNGGFFNPFSAPNGRDGIASGGGGGGGAYDASGRYGAGAAGAPGRVTLTWTQPPAPVPIMVVEAYTVDAFDNPDWVDPNASITVQLPRLSRAGVAALQKLLAREQGEPNEGSKPDGMSDQAEHSERQGEDDGG